MKNTMNKIAAAVIAAVITSAPLAANDAWITKETVNNAAAAVHKLDMWAGASVLKRLDKITALYEELAAAYGNRVEFDARVTTLRQRILDHKSFSGAQNQHDQNFNHVVAGYFALKALKPEAKLAKKDVVSLVKSRISPWYTNKWLWTGVTLAALTGVGIWKHAFIKDKGTQFINWMKAKWENFKKDDDKKETPAGEQQV